MGSSSSHRPLDESAGRQGCYTIKSGQSAALRDSYTSESEGRYNTHLVVTPSPPVPVAAESALARGELKHPSRAARGAHPARGGASR
eukprot:6758419-Pyramimonas_sp.AAC.2